MEMVITTGAIMTCKAPVKVSPPTNQHPDFLQAGYPSCHPTNSVKALRGITEGKHYQALSVFGLQIADFSKSTPYHMAEHDTAVSENP